jgi:hypothetical protein
MSLIFYGAHSSARLEPPKMNDARSEIDSFVGSDSKVFYVHNGDQEMQMEEVRGQVGSKKWTVVHESGEAAAIKSLKETVESLKETVDSMKAEFNRKFDVVEDITVVPFVRNVVAQILLYLVGAQPKKSPPVSRRFESMEESVKKRVIRCADKLGFTEKRFCNMAEAILERRNHTLHQESVVELAKLTKKAVDMVNAFPNIELVCRDEVTILRAYVEDSSFFI